MFSRIAIADFNFCDECVKIEQCDRASCECSSSANTMQFPKPASCQSKVLQDLADFRLYNCDIEITIYDAIDIPSITVNTSSTCNVEDQKLCISLKKGLQSQSYSSLTGAFLRLNTENMCEFQFLIDQAANLNNVSNNVFTEITGGRTSAIIMQNNRNVAVIPYNALLNLNYSCSPAAPAFLFRYNVIEAIDTNKQLMQLFNQILCKQIAEFNVGGNQINVIPEKTFSCMDFGTLQLSENPLNEIQINAFEDSIIEKLDLNSCGLSEKKVHINAFSNLTLKKSLNLANNRFSAFPLNYLSSILIQCDQNATFLIDLSRNLITSLEANQLIFSNLEHLGCRIDINIASNGITTLKTAAIFNNTIIEKLDLRDNPLTSIEKGAIDSSKIGQLYLSFEQLKTLYLDKNVIINSHLRAISLGAYRYDFKKALAMEFHCFYDDSQWQMFCNITEMSSIIFETYCTDFFKALACNNSELLLALDLKMYIPFQRQFETITNMWKPCSTCDYMKIDQLLLPAKVSNLELAICDCLSVCITLDNYRSSSSLTLNFGTNSVVCQQSYSYMQNSSIDTLIITGEYAMPLIPVGILNFLNLKYLKIDSLIECNCTLAVNFYEYFKNRTLIANCSNIQNFAVSSYINKNYDACKRANVDYEYHDVETEACRNNCLSAMQDSMVTAIEAQSSITRSSTVDLRTQQPTTQLTSDFRIITENSSDDHPPILEKPADQKLPLALGLGIPLPLITLLVLLLCCNFLRKYREKWKRLEIIRVHQKALNNLRQISNPEERTKRSNVNNEKNSENANVAEVLYESLVGTPIGSESSVEMPKKII